jgi:hypothetical protein
MCKLIDYDGVMKYGADIKVVFCLVSCNNIIVAEIFVHIEVFRMSMKVEAYEFETCSSCVVSYGALFCS